MRILILSCNTGEGHNSVAAALAEKFVREGHFCMQVDALSLVSERVSSTVSRAHSFIYRNLPELYGRGYRREEEHALKLPEFLFTEAEPALRRILMEQRIDAVISVHVFGGLLMTYTRQHWWGDLPAYFVATDYTCSPYVNLCQARRFFIPHPSLIPQFSQKGIPEELLVASGIPLRDPFYHLKSKGQARTELALPEQEPVVLLSSGSIGCGPIQRLCERLAEDLPQAKLVAVCGHNEKLRAKLEAKLDPARCRVLGFTDQMADYMAASDVYVTKAGGLSVTEALTGGARLVIMDAVQGCETENLAFLEEHGLAKGAKTVPALAALVQKALAGADAPLPQMPNGTQRIYDEVVSGADHPEA